MSVLFHDDEHDDERDDDKSQAPNQDIPHTGMLPLSSLLRILHDFGFGGHCGSPAGRRRRCFTIASLTAEFRAGSDPLMPVYFAYGSNMEVDAMAARCPRSTPLGLARLPRHRPALTGAGYATVLRDPRASVWGLLWTLALSDVAALDRWEEVSRGMYAKAILPVVRQNASAVQALIYIARDFDLPGAIAPRSYGANIVAAAKTLALPTAYVDTLHNLYGRPAMPVQS